MAKAPITIAPSRYVLLNLFEAITGYSPDAVQKKIKRGEWREGTHFRRAPDGHILIDMQGYEAWVEGQPAHR